VQTAPSRKGVLESTASAARIAAAILQWPVIEKILMQLGLRARVLCPHSP
jgi:hypothetical protein